LKKKKNLMDFVFIVFPKGFAELANYKSVLVAKKVSQISQVPSK